ncbi:LysM peptidoglycan-binding domain-containing protein [Archangium sp.]|uniref:LysM peptidoglycan-binding domain-containing protein n=1 Tax=Archangium sp. TaxID=1872627 RepID=UPI002D223725|nr:LysM peptidoglycan-binding domain-containing protein [Archangium sp.]HYO55441.1 LysM peptidoglycan-binding domain-containing protein [Archangium sp.]
MTSTYRVRQGDTLSAIARRNHTSVDELARANNIRDPDKIRTGQRITIPGSTDGYEGAPQRSASSGNVRQAPTNPARESDTFEPGRTAAANTVAPGASGTQNGYRNIDLNAFRQGGSNSESAIVVGTSEGNRTPDGGFRASYGGHTDPGNAAHNRGSFSYQGRGASSPQQADELWNRELGHVTPRYEQAARQAGLDPNNALLASTFYDLHTQSPRAARNFVNRELPRLARDPRGVTSESLIDARVNAYRNDAGQVRAAGFDHSESRLRADQTRREGELVRALDARGYRDGGAARPGATAEPRAGGVTPTNPNDTERVAPSSDRPAVQTRTPWYSQHDGAHVERAGNTACFRAATAMVRGAGATVTGPRNRIQVATAEGSNGVTVNRQQAERGRDYIDGQLAAGRPVVVGVNHRTGRNVGNADDITDHFVVVTGRGVDAQGRTYYQFHDPATRNESQGRDTHPSNRFYVDERTGGLYRPGNSAALYAVDRRYDVAMIRPNA